MSSRRSNSYFLPLILSIIFHCIILILLLCALYTHETTHRKESPTSERPATNVLFYPLPQQAPSGTVGQTAIAQTTASPSPSSAAPSSSASGSTHTTDADPTTQEDTQTPESVEPPPALPKTVEIAQKTTAPTTLALPERTPLDSAKKTTPDTHDHQTPRTAQNKKRANATKQLAKLSTGFFNKVEQASQQEEEIYNGTHTAQHQLNSTMEQRYYAKIWQVLKMAFDSQKKPVYLGKNVATHATLHITIARNGALIDVGLQHTRKTPEIETIEQTLVGAARAVGMFPPVPKVFSADPFIMKLPININTHFGLHNYDLVYNAPA